MPPFLDTSQTWTIWLALAGLALIVVYSGLLWRNHQRRASHLTPYEEIERTKQEKGLRGDLQTLTAEIEALSQRFGRQLDVRTQHLEQLLREADQRIAELHRLGVQESASPDSPPPSVLPIAAAHPVQTAGAVASRLPDDPLARSVYRLADSGLEASAIAKQLNEHIGKIELMLALRSE